MTVELLWHWITFTREESTHPIFFMIVHTLTFAIRVNYRISSGFQAMRNTLLRWYHSWIDGRCWLPELFDGSMVNLIVQNEVCLKETCRTSNRRSISEDVHSQFVSLKPFKCLQVYIRQRSRVGGSFEGISQWTGVESHPNESPWAQADTIQADFVEPTRFDDRWPQFKTYSTG